MGKGNHSVFESEAETIDQALVGDQGAFTALYHRHRPRVLATVGRVARCRDEAEDLVQLTFIKAFGALPTFRRESAFSTWLTRIALNVSTTHLRRRLTLQECLDAAARTLEVAPALGRPPGDAAGGLADRERREALLGGLGALPEDYRRAIWLHYIQERSYQEITQELKIPIGTLKVWLHRARARLRLEFEKRGIDAYVN
jgi:RNA polymerase sigma-70 factor (ECF subfamily)